jgi:circadian clock protein KaiB
LMSEMENRKAEAPTISLDLYVAGSTANSCRAKLNLESIVAKLNFPYTLQVVDVIQSPKLAWERRIFATPSLILTFRAQKILIVGDLSDHDAVLSALRGKE